MKSYFDNLAGCRSASLLKKNSFAWVFFSLLNVSEQFFFGAVPGGCFFRNQKDIVENVPPGRNLAI